MLFQNAFNERVSEDVGGPVWFFLVGAGGFLSDQCDQALTSTHVFLMIAALLHLRPLTNLSPRPSSLRIKGPFQPLPLLSE